MSASMLIPIITSNIIASNKHKKKSNTKVHESKNIILIGTDFEMIEYNVNGEAKTITNIVYINGMKKDKDIYLQFKSDTALHNKSYLIKKSDINFGYDIYGNFYDFSSCSVIGKYRKLEE